MGWIILMWKTVRSWDECLLFLFCLLVKKGNCHDEYSSRKALKNCRFRFQSLSNSSSPSRCVLTFVSMSQLGGWRCMRRSRMRQPVAPSLWSQPAAGNPWAVALWAATAVLCLYTRSLQSHQRRRISCPITPGRGAVSSAVAWSDSEMHPAEFMMFSSSVRIISSLGCCHVLICFTMICLTSQPKSF